MTDPHTRTEAAEPESVFAARHEVPRAALKRWREDGTLLEDEHWLKRGNAFLLTVAGQERVLEMIGIASPPLVPERVPVRAQLAGAMPRILRCKRESDGVMVSVRLTAPRVFATQFRRNDRLDVTPTETEGIYEFDGAVPRRTRI